VWPLVQRNVHNFCIIIYDIIVNVGKSCEVDKSWPDKWGPPVYCTVAIYYCPVQCT
jgi:hypothetical protein